jgi:copper homeostasis protein
MAERILLEVCVGSLDDAIVAAKGGADRIELNAALGLGGLTPSLGLVQQVLQSVSIPVIVMLRPREGGFCYSAAEWQTLLCDLERFREMGVAGFAFGFLQEDRRIDLTRCREIHQKIDHREAIFHRAFDLVPDPFLALEQLIDLGFDRILTSGQQPTAWEGRDLIRRLIDQARGRIEILPGSGIHSENVRDLLRDTGAKQIHASLKRRCIDPTTRGSNISFSPFDEEGYLATDLAKVIEMRRILNSTTEMVEDDWV